MTDDRPIGKVLLGREARGAGASSTRQPRAPMANAGPAAPAPVEHLFKILENANVSGAYNDFYNDAMGFYHAIDWSERWLLGLGAFHLLVWLVVIATRKSHDAQMVLLLVILLLVYCAEYANSYAGQHWQSFARQNYFDKRGVFVSVMYSAPLLAAALLVLLNALRAASSLLVQVKKKELQAKRRKEKKAQ